MNNYKEVKPTYGQWILYVAIQSPGGHQVAQLALWGKNFEDYFENEAEDAEVFWVPATDAAIALTQAQIAANEQEHNGLHEQLAESLANKGELAARLEALESDE